MCRNYENISIMAHGLHAMIKSEIGCSSSGKPRPGGGSSASGGAAGKMGSRRIFTPQFKLQVLDSYRNDSDCKGNQRATARKYGIHRRQIQKWLQVENNLRSAAANSANGGGGAGSGSGSAMKINLLSNSGNHHPPQFQLHPQLHHHHHHMHHQNLNSIELKVPMDSTRHRVAPNASSNNNNGKESSASGACIISPVPHTHTVPTGAAAPPSFSHPHETSASSASLSVLNGKSAAAVALAASQQVPRPTFSPVSGGEYPDRLHLLDQYYHYARYAIDCPIDLSLPQQFRGGKVEQQALSPCSTASSVYSSRPRSATPPVQEQAQENAAVDLSCRKRKSSEDSSDGASAPKSVKLFKPYLLDEKEEDKEDKDYQIDSPLPKEVGRHDYPPIIWNFHAQQRYYESLYGSEYGSGTPYGYPPSPPYPVTPIPRTPFSTLSPSPPSSSWAPPQASPVSGYDSSTSISSVYSHDGNEDTAGYSYSLELKQQAIDSYYHDVSCRGDFRAVASKFNIQRKYVEKWLAQEDHLGASNSQPPPPPLPQVVVG